jgi:hypothetical protein
MMKAIAADPTAPAIFRKSVKLGMMRATPEMIHTIIDLTKTFFNFIYR